jgi:hypothetical protein
MALSSCKAEYMATIGAACQGIWLTWLLSDMTEEETAVPMLLIDNQSAIALSKNSVFHDWSKHIDVCYDFHIDVCYHFIRECVEEIIKLNLHIH